MPLFSSLLQRRGKSTHELRSNSLDTSTSMPDAVQSTRTRAASEGVDVSLPVQAPVSNGERLFRTLRSPATIPESNPSPLQKGNKGADNSNAHPGSNLPPTSKGDSVPSDLTKRLEGAWNETYKKPRTSKADQLLEKMENAAQGTQSSTALTTGTITMLNVLGGTDVVEQGVSHLLEGSAVLMSALGEVQKLHPFIGVVVLAFQAVYTLEMNRRDNDRKIIVLHVEMRDMMAVLIQLKDMKDPEVLGPGETTLQDRLQTLVNAIADDIERCANVCDTYSKKRPVVRVIQGPIWNSRLVELVDMFSKRRSALESALSVHTALGVDAANKGIDTANETLGDVDKRTKEMAAKLDKMMEMFQGFASPEERRIKKKMDEKGGPEACETNEQLLKELSGFDHKPGLSTVGGALTGRNVGSKQYDFEDLKEDLEMSPEEATNNNRLVFQRKFDMQKRQITAEVDRIAKREADRVIRSVIAGPHDKIIDPEIRRIWKEMRWPGSAKTRHFIMALRDYYQDDSDYYKEEHDDSTQPSDKLISAGASHGQSDQWALAHINILNLQSISEAFDDDASGFVTVAEVNALTASQPEGWSLIRWIAYWAIGWHQSMANYASKIRDILAKMFAIVPLTRAANKGAVNGYLLSIYESVTTLESSLNPCFVNEVLQRKFAEYIEAEEARLRTNLESMHYDIDASDTLGLITGPGRIGKYVFPLICLLLERHFEIFRICQRMDIHPDELSNAADAIDIVMEAVKDRLKDLKSIFRQQRQDTQQQFGTFAHGLYKYFNHPLGLWDATIVRERDFPEYPYDDNMEKQGIKAEDILNIDITQELDLAAYDLPTQDVPAVQDEVPIPLKAVLGPWNGFIYRNGISKVPGGRMISMNLCPSPTNDLCFNASGRGSDASFTISGECVPGGATETVAITFRRKFKIHRPTRYFDGRLDATTDTINGTCGNHRDPAKHNATFIFKRTAPEYLRFRPSPATFKENKNLALWTYALSAVRHDVNRQSWSWSFFKKRRDIRKRFTELHIRNTEFGVPLDTNESEELRKLRQSLTSADSRFYSSYARYQVRRVTQHGIKCVNCKGAIGGARVICLICRPSLSWSVDLCENASCTEAQVEASDLAKPHLPTHDVVKVRRVVHIRQLGGLERAAKQALRRARDAFKDDQIPPASALEGYDSDDGSPAVEMTETLKSTPIDEDRKVCIFCKTSVDLNQPWWYCVKCQDPTFICGQCDASDIDFSVHGHKYSHDLVKCQEQEPPEVVEPSVEDRLAGLESKMNGLESKMDGLESKMDERWDRLDSKVDNRLAKFETMLVSMLGK